ncbi:glycosyltransferase [Ochrobactrum sp. CDB2]|nr:glycosyltransferase [Ochrobactrum sp. CDB2]
MTKVSVIIPYYNQGKYLHAAVQSALLSYSGDLEIIVVDDGSTESQASHYCAQAKNLDNRVMVIRKSNGGLSSARNAGLDAARGDYIQLLDCDDVLLPDKIDKQLSHLAAAKDKLVSVTGYYVCNESMRDFRDESHTVTRFPLTLRSFLFYWERGFSVPIHCGLFHKSVFDQIRFNESLYGKEDWIFWATLAGTYPNKLIYTPFQGVVYRLHGSGMTRARDRMGESWIQATKILANYFGGEYPEFEETSNQWHQNYYGGARLRGETGQIAHKSTPGPAKALNAAMKPRTTLCFEKERSDAEGPSLSFVVPVFNHGKHLRQCIESLVHQKPALNFEIVVFDDKSTEPGTIDILRGIDCRGIAYRVFRNEENYGVSATKKLAIERCRGNYIAFVDCCDFLEPDTVEVTSRFIESQDAPDYIFTDTNTVDDKGGLISRADNGGYPWLKPSVSVDGNLLLGMVGSRLKVIRKGLYSTLGGNDTRSCVAQDWEIALRVIKQGKFRYINRPLYNHRINSGSSCTTQMWMKNVLRRKYMTELSAAPEANTVVELNEIAVKDIPYVSKLFLDGIRFSFRADGDSLSVDVAEVLAEFNSYFDRIVLPVTEGASLMGCLWDYQIARA